MSSSAHQLESADSLLTAREVAMRFGATPRWVLNQWQAGNLPGFRLSEKMVRFRASEIDQWLEDRREGPREA